VRVWGKRIPDLQQAGIGVIMGKILYGDSGIEIAFDDRDMAHLQIVIGAKLRRKESFFFSWRDESSDGGGRSAIWMDCAIPLYFRYFGSKAPSINREWIAILAESSNNAGGLQLTPEPDGIQSQRPQPNGDRVN
jgi:hypothetical protein